MKPIVALSVIAMMSARPPAVLAQNASITVVVLGVRSSVGSVRVDVCGEDTFLKASCPYSGAAPAVQGATTVVVNDVPPGTYAAQAYHDRNDNHRVDRNAVGIPSEAIGFSNNPRLGLHGPRFAKAKFDHSSTPDLVQLELHHFPLEPKR